MSDVRYENCAQLNPCVCVCVCVWPENVDTYLRHTLLQFSIRIFVCYIVCYFIYSNSYLFDSHNLAAAMNDAMADAWHSWQF